MNYIPTELKEYVDVKLVSFDLAYIELKARKIPLAVYFSVL